MSRKMTYDEAKERMESVAHLWEASHNINYWKPTKIPRSQVLGAPATLVCRYELADKRSGLKQYWDIDEADVKEHGSLEAKIKQIHAQFAVSLTVMGLAVDKAKAAQRRIILPRDIQHQGSRVLAHQLLEKGDHDH